MTSTVAKNTHQKVNIHFNKFLFANEDVNGNRYEDGLLACEFESIKAATSLQYSMEQRNTQALQQADQALVQEIPQQEASYEKRLKIAQQYFNSELYKKLSENLSQPDLQYHENLRINRHFSDLIMILNEPYPKLTQVSTVLKLMPEVCNRLMFLVNNPAFMKQLGKKPREVDSIQTAIGMIGIQLIRVVLPLLLLKSKINFYSAILPSSGMKIWRHVLTTALTTRYLLKKEGYHRPDDGIMIAAMVSSGIICAYQEFPKSYEQVRLDLLMKARQKNDHVLHELLSNTKPEAKLLNRWLFEHQYQLSYNLVMETDIKGKEHLIDAIVEQKDNLEVSKRSYLGQVLYRALSYSIFEQLSSANQFPSQALEEYTKLSALEQSHIEELNNAKLFQLDLSALTREVSNTNKEVA